MRKKTHEDHVNDQLAIAFAEIFPGFMPISSVTGAPLLSEAEFEAKEAKFKGANVVRLSDNEDQKAPKQ
jgi:hypothetical protein